MIWYALAALVAGLALIALAALLLTDPEGRGVDRAFWLALWGLGIAGVSAIGLIVLGVRTWLA